MEPQGKTAMRRVAVLVVMMALVVGCGVFSDGEVVLSTNKGTYSLDSTTVIKLTVENQTEETIYYICTGQIYLEEIHNGERQGSWMVHGFEECLAPGPIEAEKSETFDIDMGQLFHYGHLAGATFDEYVTYRLEVDLFDDELFENLIGDDQRVSGEFQIIRE